MRYEPVFENELPDLWERDAEIADRVLADEPRDRFVAIVNRFAWLADYCDSDIEAAMCVGLCAVAVPPDANVRDFIWPQFWARPFRLDFLLWPRGGEDRTHCIGIECDGAAYHSSAQQQSYDAWRERKILERYGIPIIRFSGRQIFADAKGCVREALTRARDFRRQGIVAKLEAFRRSEGPRSVSEIIADRLTELRG